MLPIFYREYDRDARPQIQKAVAGEDASDMGAFSFGTQVDLTVRIPRRLGCGAVVLRLWPDGQAEKDYPLAFFSTERGMDTYRLTLDTAAICGGQDCGLFYYQLLFVRGADTLFTDSVNNLDFTLCDHGGTPFRLLVYTADFRTPAWFPGGVMYHIFVDRFFRGEGAVTLREGCHWETDWDNGIPEYPPYPGAPLANNRFFGGNLWGVAQKMDWLAELGVTVLYLSPIFESASNHKYDTADYETVDSTFGGEAALDALLQAAKAHGIRIILDGVFNHTGDDSRYFNRYGRYAEVGAYQSSDSPYAAWYHFKQFPDRYDCWWNIPILPRINGDHPDCRAYLAGRDGIAAMRVRGGIAGWRLDVADELSNGFLEELRESTHAAANEQPLIIGEVWENAVDKMAYGARRRYFLGKQLDSVMNYPLRDAIITFLKTSNATVLYNTLTELYSSYPRPVCHALMNLLGTHDTVRILTVLGDPQPDQPRTNDTLAVKRLDREERAHALSLLRCAMTILFTVYGVPCVYYGDDAGLEGYHDPFCRLPYPWGREEQSLQAYVRFLGALRHEHSCFACGDFRVIDKAEHAIAYERWDKQSGDRIITAVNMDTTPWALTLDGCYEQLSEQGSVPMPPVVEIPSGQAMLLRSIS